MLKPRFLKCALKDRVAFRDALAQWFLTKGRDLPWRRTREPYEILVSEVMLQQTQVATVLGRGYYRRFLAKFSDLETLAAAGDEDLLKAWEGLGYYRRARMLRETARAVMEDHGGEFPQEVADLLKLPGIGRYTAGALRAFAFGLPAVLVDGNVARVLSRVMDFADAVDETPGLKQLWSWAGDLACDARPAVYHAALMELGQIVCRPGVPDCQGCPVADFCMTREPVGLPVKKRKVAMTWIDEHALWLCDRRGRILLHREDGKRRTGLWKLPVREHAEVVGLPVVLEMVYPITRYRVTLRVHDGGVAHKVVLQEGEAWVEPGDWRTLAMAAPFRKAVGELADGGGGD